MTTINRQPYAPTARQLAHARALGRLTSDARREWKMRAQSLPDGYISEPNVKTTYPDAPAGATHLQLAATCQMGGCSEKALPWFIGQLEPKPELHVYDSFCERHAREGYLGRLTTLDDRTPDGARTRRELERIVASLRAEQDEREAAVQACHGDVFAEIAESEPSE